MGRAPCCDTTGLKKGPWTPEEDQKLIDYIHKHGYGNWRTLPKNAGLQRCGKSCRLRWTNYLRPDIKRGRFSFEEEETIIQLHSILGNKWSAIAARLPGRTDNEIKNYWNTHIRKRLLRMGIDPVTHSPRLDLLDLSSFLTSNMYHNNQNFSSSNSDQMSNITRLMGMQSSSASVHPELLWIATSLMSHQPQTNNEVGDYYAQTQFYPYIPHQHHHQSLIQLHALQQPMAPDYCPVSVPIAESNLSDDVPMPFTGFLNYGLEQRQSIGFATEAEQRSHVVFDHPNGQNPIPNSVLPTPSSSPNDSDSKSNSNAYINNSSCNSTEDERENNSAADYSSSLMTMMMKFEIPEMFDVSDFIY
ncbi:hypothetical protein QQ045_027838 [Rhodiola kirilowii]